MTVVDATANYGYHFDHWSNGSTANPDTLHLTGDSVLTAYFAPNSYTLTVEVNDSSLGAVTLPLGSTAFYGDTLMLVASPVEHYHVNYWYGISWESSTQDTAWIVMAYDCTVYCYFSIDMHTVTATPNDPTRGTITGGNTYEYGSSCILTAIPFEGYTFGGWSNGVTSNPYAFLVEGDVELTAIFLSAGEETYTVTVESADPTMGTVSGGGQAVYGGEVTIRAIANPGYRFLRWNDNDTHAVRTVTVTEDVTYTAYFESMTQGISNIDADNVWVYAANGRIVIEGTDGNQVTLYDAVGRVISGKRRVESGKVEFAVPTSGVYLVRVGDHPARRVVVIR